MIFEHELLSVPIAQLEVNVRVKRSPSLLLHALPASLLSFSLPKILSHLPTTLLRTKVSARAQSINGEKRRANSLFLT